LILNRAKAQILVEKGVCDAGAKRIALHASGAVLPPLPARPAAR
jgi:hypothetical protein